MGEKRTWIRQRKISSSKKKKRKKKIIFFISHAFSIRPERLFVPLVAKTTFPNPGKYVRVKKVLLIFFEEIFNVFWQNCSPTVPMLFVAKKRQE